MDQSSIIYTTLDTSFLLECHKKLTDLFALSAASKSSTCVHFVVPYIVVQELDILSKRSSSPEAQRKASLAVNAIRSALRDQSRKVLNVQTLFESNHRRSPVLSSNDDYILDCALYFGTSRVCRSLLLTNDRNLALKAEGHGIASFTASESFPTPDLLDQIVIGATKISDPFAMDWEPEELLCEDRMQCEERSESPVLLSFYKAVEGSSLESTLKRLYEDSIGPHWISLLPSKAQKQPWSFQFMLECVESNWTSVFASNLPKYLKISVHKLRTLLPLSQSSQVSPKQMHQIIRETDSFLLALGIDISDALRKLSTRIRV